MKKLFALFALLVFLGSCGGDDDSTTVCEEAMTGTCTYEACSDGSNTYYTWNGNRYNCNGNDCTAAAESLVADQIAAGCLGAQ